MPADPVPDTLFPSADDAASRPPTAPEEQRTVLQSADSQVAAVVVPSVLPKVDIPGYEILGELGRGGMGVVYRARQVGLNRTVALKMILGGGHAGSDDLARFRVEAEAVARLAHPNIVQIYDVGENDGLPYFSLEFVAGGSLAGKLDGTPWPAQRAAGLVEALARAMDVAHRQHIIHRDLKPANILLAPDGTPKVTDFGLAKNLDSQHGTTQTGAVLGTPSYMAPEQAAGQTKEVGPATDVYALGAILYELLTGRPPFKGASPLDTMLLAVEQEPVPPTRLNPQVPRDLETVCLKCLQKKPIQRYDTAAGLADDLHRFLAGEPISARPVGALERTWRWCRRNRAVAALLVAVATSLVLGTVVSLSFAVQASRNATLADAAAEAARLRADAEAAAKEQAEEQRQRAEEQRRLAEEQRRRADTFAADASRNAARADSEAEAARMRANAEAAAKREAEKQRLLAETNAHRAEENATLAEARSRETRGVVDRYFTEVSENDLLNEPGLEPLRRKLLTLARDHYAKLVRERRADGTAQAELGRNLARLALITGEAGELVQAIDLERQAADIFAAGAADLRPDLGGADYHLGRLYRLNGQFAEAEAAATKAVAVWEGLAADRTDPAVTNELARSLQGLANVLRQVRRFGEADAAYRRALDLRQKRADAAPDDAANLRDLAVTWDNLGGCLGATGDARRSADAHRQALAILRKLVESHPEHPRYRDDLGRSLFNLGSRLRVDGSLAGAADAYAEAVTTWDRLTELHPTVAVYRTQLASAAMNLSVTQRQMGQTAAADASLGRAVEVAEKLVRDLPDYPDGRQRLADVFMVRADARRGSGDDEAARADYARAAELLEPLLAKSPRSELVRTTVAKCFMGVGQAAMRQKKHAPARAAYQRAVELLQEQDRLTPKQADVLSTLGISWTNLGDLDRLVGRRELALVAYDRAEQLLKPWADHPEVGPAVKAALQNCARGREQARKLGGP